MAGTASGFMYYSLHHFTTTEHCTAATGAKYGHFDTSKPFNMQASTENDICPHSLDNDGCVQCGYPPNHRQRQIERQVEREYYSMSRGY
jgi:hypothetical protein